MTYYNNHIFICNNLKENSKKCCGLYDSNAIINYAKQRAKELNLNKETKFRISASGCLGRCAEGPVLVIYPQGKWYTYKSLQDIDAILPSIAADMPAPTELHPSNP